MYEVIFAATDPIGMHDRAAITAIPSTSVSSSDPNDEMNGMSACDMCAAASLTAAPPVPSSPPPEKMAIIICAMPSIKNGEAYTIIDIERSDFVTPSLVWCTFAANSVMLLNTSGSAAPLLYVRPSRKKMNRTWTEACFRRETARSNGSPMAMDAVMRRSMRPNSPLYAPRAACFVVIWEMFSPALDISVTSRMNSGSIESTVRIDRRRSPMMMRLYRAPDRNAAAITVAGSMPAAATPTPTPNPTSGESGANGSLLPVTGCVLLSMATMATDMNGDRAVPAMSSIEAVSGVPIIDENMSIIGMMMLIIITALNISVALFS